MLDSFGKVFADSNTKVQICAFHEFNQVFTLLLPQVEAMLSTLLPALYHGV